MNFILELIGCIGNMVIECYNLEYQNEEIN